MVHRDYHWHATESCFYCANCQVSLITSPFLLKFEEIFCSSNCAQEYSLSQLSDKPSTKAPQIEIIEDNPVDRNSIHSILRKESSPSPPATANGLAPPAKRKVMFHVETLETPGEDPDEIKRSISEEEFAYLEQSLNEGQGDGGRNPTENSPSPLSESSLSNSPLSDNTEPFFSADISHDTDDDDVNNKGDNDVIKLGDNDITENQDIVPSIPDDPEEALIEDDDMESDKPSCNVDDVVNETPVDDPVVEDEPQTEVVSSQNGVVSEVEPEARAPECELEQDTVVLSDETAEIVGKDSDKVEKQESVDVPQTPDIVITDIMADLSISDDIKPDDDKGDVIQKSESDDVTKPVEANVVPEADPLSDKENDRPPPTQVASDTDIESMKPPKKPARGKLSSASFNRVLRKIDRTGNDSLSVEPPGKRLRYRPRSLSSLSTHNRNLNTIEHKDNLVSMYALAPDIADMVASVYKNQTPINTTIRSAEPCLGGNRTLAASSPASDTSRDSRDRPSGHHKRNPSYEAAELVLQLDVESEGESAAVSTTKHITLSTDEPIKPSPEKSPKKGIKQRLSFKKKKNKSPEEAGNTNNLDESFGKPKKRKEKKACVVM